MSHQQKQQAKQLLLKGCYKMSKNKYEQLIKAGQQQFTNREWAVIHLNLGLCLQFLELHEPALRQFDLAIQIDPKYEKGYYRKVQLLRSEKRFVEALSTVPPFIRNQEILDQLAEIKEAYLGGMELDLLIEKMQDNEFNAEAALASHHSLYEKIVGLRCQLTKARAETIGTKLKRYYLFLYEKSKEDRQIWENIVGSFAKVILKLVIFAQENQDNNVRDLLSEYWNGYGMVIDEINVSKKQLLRCLTQPELDLLPYQPQAERALNILSNLQISLIQGHDQETLFTLSFKIVHLLSLLIADNNHKNISFILFLQGYSDRLAARLDYINVAYLSRCMMLIDNCICLQKTIQPIQISKISKTVDLFYMRHHYINTNKLDRQQSLIRLPHESILIEYLLSHISNFLIVFVFEQIVHCFDRSNSSIILKEIEELIQMQTEIDSCRIVHKQSQFRNQLTLLQTSLALKVDLKYSMPNRMKINSLFQMFVLDCDQDPVPTAQLLTDVALNTLMLYCLSSPSQILTILHQCKQAVLRLLKCYFRKGKLQQLHSIHSVINFLVVLLCDFQEQQIRQHAIRMGVDKQQILKAKELQGDKRNQAMLDKLVFARKEFVIYFEKGYLDIVQQLCGVLCSIGKQSPCMGQLAKVMRELADVDASRLCQSSIINAMMLAYDSNEKSTGEFFAKLCKKINPQSLKYEHFQKTVDILMLVMERGDHELTIFEALLGLVNLTGGTTKVTVSVSRLEKCFFQENQYIVHAAMEVMNNVLASIQDEQQLTKYSDKMKELVLKYHCFYCEKVKDLLDNNDAAVSISDYSHPGKIYTTILSLAMVMDLQIPELIDWRQAQIGLKMIQCSRSITLFKLVMFHRQRKRLPRTWSSDYINELAELRGIDNAKWQKLMQLV